MIRKERETTKVRIVYDGSAKSSKEEQSLNDCLETGTNHIPLVFNMLANFRANRIGLIADIEKAFLMIGIKEEDRDMLPFLWFNDPAASAPEISKLMFNGLVFGLRPSSSISPNGDSIIESGVQTLVNYVIESSKLKRHQSTQLNKIRIRNASLSKMNRTPNQVSVWGVLMSKRNT